MKNRNVLISGASIAGPAMAFWLNRYGFTTTVVERAPALRAGGFAVDFRGAAHLTVLERMGVLEEIKANQTNPKQLVVVDGDGKQQASLPISFAGGDVEIMRGDLSRILYERTKDRTEYLFGDQLTSLTETADGVNVTFQHAPPRTFDLVIGADGLHSGVRALAFGPESQYLQFLGHYVAGFSSDFDPNPPGKDMFYNEPGRMASVGLFVFASEQLDYDRHDTDQQKKIVASAFSGMGWHTPALVKAMENSTDLYFDSISKIVMDRHTKGRVALLGDAGYGATMGGMGNGMAMVGAYVLAGELAAAGGDYRVAFASYEEQIRDYAKGCQKVAGNAGPFLAPPTVAKLRRRNRTYRMISSSKLMTGFLTKMTKKAANAITLKNYAG